LKEQEGGSSTNSVRSRWLPALVMLKSAALWPEELTGPVNPA
jgi:hypothetical protein